MPPKRAKKVAAKASTSKKRKIESENEAENFKENVDSSESDRKSDTNEKQTPSQSSKKAKEDSDDLTKIKNLVAEENRMEMPDDFYEFLDFCKSINPSDPKNALNNINLKLVGIYDLVLSELKTDYKLYYRYFYDPPEFQTVIEGDEETLLHFGYFRDDPNELPDFVAINEAKKDCKIQPKGDNIFAAVNWYLDELLNKKTYKVLAKADEIEDLKRKLNKWVESSKKFFLQLKSDKMKARDKKMNCKTFHQAGIVVPVNPRGFGYRDLPETYETLKKIFTNYCQKSDEKKKAKAEESLQEIMTLLQFANDESDYGTGLEFGLCLFSFGNEALHKYVRIYLNLAYMFLNRSFYSEIIKAHLTQRTLQITS